MALIAPIFLEFNLPNATTWFYFSFLMAVALFFKFGRLLSVRNLDVVLLFVLVPGLLLLLEAKPNVTPMERDPAVAAARIIGMTATAAAMDVAGPAGIAAGLTFAGDDLLYSSTWLWWGYLWLLAGSAYWLIRCLIDLALVGRPALAPNLSFGGLAWLAGTLFICLIAVAFRPERTQGGQASPLPIAIAEKQVKPIGPETTALALAQRPFPWLARTLAVLCHLAVIVGLIVVGYRHFQDPAAGMASATLYLMLPYTGIYVGQAHHVWPVALIVWAMVAYRLPIASGILLGLAGVTAYFPVVLLPIWISFYWGRGARRFLAGYLLTAGLCLGAIGLVLWSEGGDLARIIREGLSLPAWQPWRVPTTEGFWTGVHWAYRIPIFIAYIAFVITTTFWPMPKNLAHVIALSAAVLIGIQFWYADQGGVYVLWYLPLLVLMVFRPNLSERQPAPRSSHRIAFVRLRRLLRRLAQRFRKQQESPIPVAGLLFALGAFAFWQSRVSAQPDSARHAEFFEARIRPVLVENCFKCHGPEKQKGDLRLDSRMALLKGGESGPAIVAGKPKESLLIQAIRHEGDVKMPPNKKLSAEAIEALSAWVKLGAPWPEGKSKQQASDGWKRHWAFQPIRNPSVPAVKNAAWPSTAIDRFILARLEEKSLTPSVPADRITLLRRATFDLIGLPPTPKEIDDFAADNSTDAFARVVDRLLASPHYGERWGRYWLDVARYADTKGYVFFQDSSFTWAYTYRDYVIRAFNEDLPFDQFIREQLAADFLLDPSNPDRRPLTALGFLTLGGRFMNNQHDIIDDRIDVVTRGLMGLTVTCARCHEHKYDPISAKDYYALYGVFASCLDPEVPPLFEPPPKTDVYSKFDKELKAREKKLDDFVHDKMTDLVKSARSRAAEYLLAAQALRSQPGSEEFMIIADAKDLNPTMSQRWRAFIDRFQKTKNPVFVPWHLYGALKKKEFAEKAPPITASLQSRKDVNPLVARALVEKPPTSMKDVAERYGEVLNAVEKEWQANKKPFAEADKQALHRVFHGNDAPPDLKPGTFNDLQLLPDRASQGVFQKLRKEVETWRATGPGAPPRAMVLQETPTPHKPRVFIRGNPTNLGEAVPRRFVSFLAGPSPKPFSQGSGRLELAHAIATRDNPLTARVIVNRIWLGHFGSGLVRTPSDFGLRSEPPTNPELLDYLATFFMDNGWSIKKLHRLMMLSKVYQQRSEDRPECLAVDADNRLFWKMPRRRLDFEALRDSLLAVAGRLDSKVGGPSVGDIASSASTRRTLYGSLDRLNLPGLYRTFDFPNPDATSPQRDVTTVPQQALFLMNNALVQDMARHALQRPEIAGEKELASKTTRLYRLLYGRSSLPAETDLAREFLSPENNSDTAWQRYVQALLLANEFAFVD